MIPTLIACLLTFSCANWFVRGLIRLRGKFCSFWNIVWRDILAFLLFYVPLNCIANAISLSMLRNKYFITQEYINNYLSYIFPSCLLCIAVLVLWYCISLSTAFFKLYKLRANKLHINPYTDYFGVRNYLFSINNSTYFDGKRHCKKAVRKEFTAALYAIIKTIIPKDQSSAYKEIFLRNILSSSCSVWGYKIPKKEDCERYIYTVRDFKSSIDSNSDISAFDNMLSILTATVFNNVLNNGIGATKELSDILKSLFEQFTRNAHEIFKHLPEFTKKEDEINASVLEDGRKIETNSTDGIAKEKKQKIKHTRKNTKRLLDICEKLIERYESDVFAKLSCKHDLMTYINSEVKQAKNEIAEWKDYDTDYIRIAHTILANGSFDLLASGKYHIYRGILDHMKCTDSLLKVYDESMSWGVKNGMIDAETKEEQRSYLFKCISEVG